MTTQNTVANFTLPIRDVLQQSGKRSFARNQCGRLWTAYVPTDTSNKIRTAYSVDDGATWITDQDISFTGTIYALQLLLDDDEIPHLFFQFGTSFYESAKSNDDGTWTTPTTIITNSLGIPGDDFSGCFCFDDDGYCHALTIGSDARFTEGEGSSAITFVPPPTNLWYSTNQSGTWQTIRCFKTSEGLDVNGDSTDVCAVPVIVSDRINNLHMSFCFSMTQNYTTGDEFVTTHTINARTIRYYAKKDWFNSFTTDLPKQYVLEKVETSNVTSNPAYRSYAQLIDQFRGSLCVDEEFVPHLAYKWATTFPPFPTFNALKYAREDTTQRPGFGWSKETLGDSVDTYTQNPSVSVSLETGSSDRTAWVIFEGIDLATLDSAFPGYKKIYVFSVTKAGHISDYQLIVDTWSDAYSPVSLHSLIPYFAIAAQEQQSKWRAFYFQDNEDGGDPSTTTRIILLSATSYANQVSPYTPLDLMPCHKAAESLTTLALVGEGSSEATYPYAPDFPFEVSERFDSFHEETDSENPVTFARRSTTRRLFQINHKNVSKTVSDAVETFLAARRGANDAFTFTTPEGESVKVHALEDSFSTIKTTLGLYDCGFTAEELF